MPEEKEETTTTTTTNTEIPYWLQPVCNHIKTPKEGDSGSMCVIS